ncbi:2630_t:CDS:1, partial [Scutellospora calospora]
EVVNSEVIDNSKDIEVSIIEIEEAVIYGVIRDNNLQNKLSKIARLLKGKKKLDIHTDSLLVVEKLERREIKKIDISWVVADN